MFTVTTERGFLPTADPLVKLPEEYKELEMILQDMPITKHDGSPGLLAEEKLGPTIDSGRLPEYDLTQVENLKLLHALFRDYTFLASAYMLEPCHKRFLETGEYGLGRSRLPKCIAAPLSAIGKKLRVRPFMEYALSYALMNWKLVDASKGFTVENMRIIRAFEGSTDESGFILVHVAMVAHSGGLVDAGNRMIEGAKSKDRVMFNQGIKDYYKSLCLVNGEMETMWKHSLTFGYNRFRTFIMGIKDQPMFPNGVIYEGVIDSETDEVNPTFNFRGESGANDSMIPLSDNLLQLTELMPKNPLTDILKDFRRYRPPAHTEYLAHVEEEAKSLKIRDFAVADAESAKYYLQCLDKVREFRSRHWNFTKEYILKHSNHPRATGGSPIVSWLPNQLQVVLNAIATAKCDDYQDIKRKAEEQSKKLCEEVEKLALKRQ